MILFAAAQAGLVTVLLGTRQQKPEIAYVLTDCGARLLIHEASLAERVPDAKDVPDLRIVSSSTTMRACRRFRVLPITRRLWKRPRSARKTPR